MTERGSLFESVRQGRAPQFVTRLVGRDDSPATEWNSLAEEQRWVGKSWRRVELLTQRYFDRGQQIEVNRTLTIHLGRRRGGFNVTLILSRSHFDYSEERP